MNVVSKNPYDALGNDHDEDSDREEAPVKVIDKTPARTTKRNAPAEAPASKNTAHTEGRGGRRGGFTGNEGAFRDHNAGSANNQGKSTVENGQENRRGGREGRGGRGGRGARQMDRHSRTVGGDSEKQAGHGWGANEGNAELADENAGEAMAQAEQKDAMVNDGENTPVDGAAEPAAEPEPEDHSISYADYLAQQAEKKLALGSGVPEPRKPNEGKQDKKWANAKQLAKEEDEDFIAGSGGKAKRERERKQKQVVDIDHVFVEPDRGRGGLRGGRGRGDAPFRGGRGDRGDAAPRCGRSEFRGGRGEGRGRGGRGGDFRGGYRNGPRGGAPINTDDTSAFPSLGA